MWNTHERRKWMFALFFGSVSLYASRTVLPICSVALSGELQWNRQETGLVMGVFFWGYALTQFLAGYLSDRLGGERVIPCTAFVWSLLTFMFVYIPQLSPDPTVTFCLFVITRFFLGVFQGFYYPSLVSLMARRVQSTERNLTHAVLNAGTHLGTLFCGSLGSHLVATSGWRTPFALIGLFGCTWSAAVHFILNHRNRNSFAPSKLPTKFSELSQIATEDADTKFDLTQPSDVIISIASSNPVDPKGHLPADQRTMQPFPWLLFLRRSAFWAMLLANFVHNNCFYIILNWCPSYFHDTFPDARSWVFNTIPWIVMFPSVLVSGLIADRWIAQGVPVTFVRKSVNTVVLLGSAIFLLMVSLLESYYASLICMALALGCLGFHSSGVLLNAQDIAPHHGGQMYGVMATVGTLPGFFGVYFAGYLLEVTHNWSPVFFLTALINIFGWMVYTRYGSSVPLI